MGGRGFIEYMGAQLDAQNATDGIIKACLGDRAVLSFADHIGVKFLPVGRGVIYVEAGIEGRGAIFIRTARNLSMGQPVPHDEAVETHLAL